MKLSLNTSLIWILLCGWSLAAEPEFRAGAMALDISPRILPAIRNGGFLQAQSDRVDDPLHARCLVLSDGQETIAIAIVDSCMFPSDICEAIKTRVTAQIGLPKNRILISATHTHSAPSVMAYCLGSGRDEAYIEYVVPRVASAIVAAHGNLQPAKIGWGSIDSPENTNCRRWITRSTQMGVDPFGLRSVRAMMHPGYQNPNYVGPSGPIDPQLSVISVASALDDRPICVMGNYSMHYFGGAAGFSADYFGDVARELESQLSQGRSSEPRCVGIMSQGTSGDLHWMNYAQPQRPLSQIEYSKAIAAKILNLQQRIQHRGDITLAMAETRLKLQRRVPNPERLAWAQTINQQRGDQPPRNQVEVYAQQAEWIDQNREAELTLQAVRIGELAMTALPNEVYGITGLKLKQQSPLEQTFNLELANGAEGYIPPPEQHALGGYTTWPARTAGLEQQAEPKIVAAVLQLLEQVSDKPRRPHVDPPCDYSRAVIDSKPVAYWRLGDIASDHAADTMGNHHAEYDGGVALYLPGPSTGSFGNHSNRCVYFAGGRVTAQTTVTDNQYSVELWMRNELPHTSRPVTGYLFTRGVNLASGAPGDSLGIGGTDSNPGRLFVFNGNDQSDWIAGQTELETGRWYHVALTRSDENIRVFLDGKLEIDGKLPITYPQRCDQFSVGGRNDDFANFDGKIDEVALYDRVLTEAEIQSHAALGIVDPAVQQPETSSQELQPTPPDISLRQIHVPPGYEVQLVASEPMIKDPVAIDWGHDGKLWVVEMADYPLGIDGQGKPGGRVRFLTDSDADGQYDTSSLFADGLSFPTGILAWGNGVLVTAAPEILYLEDSDNDGKADVRRTLFTGFLEGNQQLRVNGLRLGLDGWVYCASGSHHSGYGKENQIKSTITGQSVAIGSRDFRIRPDTGAIEPESGPSQYGRNRDDWGNWFGVQNSLPLWHYVLADEDIRRNPHFAPPDPKWQVVTPINPPVYPVAKLQKRFHSFEQSGRFTSACSAMIYRDELLFQRHAGQQHAFTCEPFHNLVQHNIILDDGVSFGFRRDPAESKYDFFASPDRWCRPVMVRTGPDGGLWVVDMYRYMIEHPEWLPDNGKEELRAYYRHGEQQGRIYRVVPKSNNNRNRWHRLIDLSASELVGALESPNGWCRDAAQQRLVRMADPASLGLLQNVARTSDFPLARLHALCTLDALDELPTDLLEFAVIDESSGVRRQAVRLAAHRPIDIQKIASLVNDPDAKVRLQLAVTLGTYTGTPAALALAELAVNSASDPYITANVIGSLSSQNLAEVLTLYGRRLDRFATVSLDQRNLQRQLFGQASRLGDSQSIGDIIALICKPVGMKMQAWQFLGLADLLDGLHAQDFSLEQIPAKHQQSIDRAIQTARNSLHEPSAIRLLLRQPHAYQSDLQLLMDQITPQSSIDVQIAAVNRLSESTDPQIATKMISGWKSYGPALRAQILDILARRSDWSRQLLAKVNDGTVSVAEMTPSMRQNFLATPDETLRHQWEELFDSGTDTERKKLIARFQPALKLPGDARRGEQVFEKHCATCHRLGNTGHDVGPNLASITDKRPESLLLAILDPSAAVEARYLNYIVLTSEGQVLSGLLSTETASSITLTGTDGKQQMILRKDIEELSATEKSFMPEGIDKNLSLQDIADLIQRIGH